MSVAPLALIMLQPDLGSAMVVAVAAFGVLLAAGVRARWTIGLTALGVAGAVFAIHAGVLAQYQVARFTNFTHPNADIQGTGYNVLQARIAIAHGGSVRPGPVPRRPDQPGHRARAADRLRLQRGR